MIVSQVAPLGFAPSSIFDQLSVEEAAELDAWLDALPEAPEQCEICLRPASPCVDGRCLRCSGEVDPALPLPWEHGRRQWNT